MLPELSSPNSSLLLWREDLLLFSYFAFADKNMKSQCRNHLFFSLNFFKPQTTCWFIERKRICQVIIVFSLQTVINL